MKSDEMDERQLTATLASLQREMTQLSERLTKLEQRLSADAPPHADATGAGPSPVAAAEINSELLAVLSAAVAAYLGVKPHIRQIRLVRSEAWAQRGRMTLQASHDLSAPRSSS